MNWTVWEGVISLSDLGVSHKNVHTIRRYLSWKMGEYLGRDVCFCVENNIEL
jgi:hypothetical protein